MTVGELIEKLSKLPPSTVVTLEGELGYDPEGISVYRMRANVRRGAYGSIYVYRDNGRDDVEDVALITQYGQIDEMEAL